MLLSHFTVDNAEAPGGAGTRLSSRKSKLHAGLSDSEIQALIHHTTGRKAKDSMASPCRPSFPHFCFRTCSLPSYHAFLPFTQILPNPKARLLQEVLLNI